MSWRPTMSSSRKSKRCASMSDSQRQPFELEADSSSANSAGLATLLREVANQIEEFDVDTRFGFELEIEEVRDE
jgi:hypothetical protein